MNMEYFICYDLKIIICPYIEKAYLVLICYLTVGCNILINLLFNRMYTNIYAIMFNRSSRYDIENKKCDK